MPTDREVLQSIVDAYDCRSELFTSNEECAANLYDRARKQLAAPAQADADDLFPKENREFWTKDAAPGAVQEPFRWISQHDAEWLKRNEKVGSASIVLMNKGGGSRVPVYLAAAAPRTVPAGAIRVSKGQLTGVDVPKGVILDGTYDLLPRG